MTKTKRSSLKYPFIATVALCCCAAGHLWAQGQRGGFGGGGGGGFWGGGGGRGVAVGAGTRWTSRQFYPYVTCGVAAIIDVTDESGFIDSTDADPSQLH